MNPVDWDKPVVYRGQGGEDYPVVASYGQPNGDRICIARYPDGKYMVISSDAKGTHFGFRNVDNVAEGGGSR